MRREGARWMLMNPDVGIGRSLVQDRSDARHHRDKMFCVFLIFSTIIVDLAWPQSIVPTVGFSLPTAMGDLACAAKGE
ncbi:uncharacterized protein SCHCODRAFT_02643505 [Schizophyllum commune H4-8]|uniref:uncharacterized protein n=1 Tax=Schizophyllum commune (strain H4-8 / FGSC 9210) TaxID=578458 RepID=UPI002160687F|nr:uncharacterized protein SCHCODRAFT_02643505 [Schizophyllum commune H4-8]KAI5886206.1 hypothetical protein SCHCODRAFT_02643505 [Schizophyllum commune H4-8]